jgi:quercetin dioxygenase-like cupin family protein
LVGEGAGIERHEIVSGEAFELPPGTVHRIEALEDALLVEASSPEVDDVVRLADDYGRAGR